MQAAALVAAAVKAAEDELFARAGFRSGGSAAAAPPPHAGPTRNGSGVGTTTGLPTSEEVETLALLWRVLSKGADELRAQVRINATRPQSDIVAEGVRLGVFVRQQTDHPHCTRSCSWENFVTNYGYQHPGIGKRYRATGDVYICTYSGRVHVCNETDCVPYLQNAHGTYVCTVSGRSRGSAVAMAEARADKATIKAADALTTSLANGPVVTTGRFGRPVGGATNKRKTPEETSADGSVPAVPAPRQQQFAPGSAAEKYLQHLTVVEKNNESVIPLTAQPALPSVVVRYGVDLIHFHFGHISEQSRRSATEWCRILLVSSSAQRLHDDNLAETERQFDDAIGRIRHVFEIDPAHYAVLVFQLCFQIYSPHVDRVVWSTLARRTDTEELISYFSTALLYVWKIVECTPKCCSNPHAALAQHFSSGSGSLPQYHAPPEDVPTSKRRRASFHLDKCALAIIYMLAEGHALNVFHDAITGQIISETDAERLVSEVLPNGKMRVNRERIEFIPPHRFLQSTLPVQNQVRRFDFSSVLIKGNGSARTPQAQAANASAANFNPNMVTITGQLQEAFRSLCNIRPALSLEQMKQYRLAHHLTIRDFCKVGDSSIVSEAERPPQLGTSES